MTGGSIASERGPETKWSGASASGN